MLASYYSGILTSQGECLKKSLQKRGNELAKAHQSISDVSSLFSIAEGQSEFFVYNSLLHDLGLSLFYAATGQYRQALVSQRVVLENAAGALYYSAHLIELKNWAEGRQDVSWSTVSESSGGIYTRKYAQAFFSGVEEHCESEAEKARKLYSYLSDFVHKHVSVHSYDIKNFEFDEGRLDDALEAFGRLVESISFPFCVRYLSIASKDKIQSIEDEILDLVGHYSAVREFVIRS